ncbi:hypothetical protein EVA_07301 [gut metagenome]|uniref:Uncharacterized protein n=1 Tax=gut metagenome TaxID=749906 RepID=J9CWI5_9ZZZZ
MNQAGVGILHRSPQLFSAFATCPAHEHLFCNASSTVGFHFYTHLQKSFPLASVKGQNPVTCNLGNRLCEVIIAGINTVFFFGSFALNHTESIVKPAQLGTQCRIVTYDLSQNVPCSEKSCVRIRNLFIQILNSGLFRFKCCILL